MLPVTVEREYRRIHVSQLIAPELDARMGRDDEKLDELAHDIARRGLIFPIAVVPVGDRYEVVDGERRRQACARLNLVEVPCIVYATKDVALEGVKYAANAYREEMSPAEEATFFHELYLTKCHEDIDEVCKVVGKKRPYVDSRLQLVLGDDQVFDAVRARLISMGVAAELNRLPDESWRRWYLQWAIRDGATVAVVQGWVTDWKNTHTDRPIAPESPTVVVAGTSLTPVYDPMRCYICQESNEHLPIMISVHLHCQLAILDRLLAAYRGDGSSER